MPRQSAGLIPYRLETGQLEVFLTHPGGPFWARKDLGSWTIVKGEYADPEAPLDAARREFTEETGFIADGRFIPLGQIRQTGGKLVTAWAIELDLDPAALRSNTFSMEWPPKSGRTREFPEVDRAAWFSVSAALEKILQSQAPLIHRLVETLR